MGSGEGAYSRPRAARTVLRGLVLVRPLQRLRTAAAVPRARRARPLDLSWDVGTSHYWTF